MHHTYQGNTLDFTVSYKKRNRYRIQVNPYGLVELEAPKGTQIETIIRIIEHNWIMIMEKVMEVKQKNDPNYVKSYENNETFLYLGKAYPIKICHVADISKDRVTFVNQTFMVEVKELQEDKIQQALKRFYYKECKSIVNERIKRYQSNFKMKPKLITINDDKTTWGTCNSKFELTFNWKLAMAPMESIDYVVVHELCHMVHLNHDRSFWRLVGKIMPDYEVRKEWLDASSWKMIL